ncbi:MAG: heparinase II/III family protein [Armatimonadia bacterium]
MRPLMISLLSSLLPLCVWAADQAAPAVEVKPVEMKVPAAIAPLMELSEEDMLKLVPEQSGLFFVGCVNCSGGQQESQLTEWDVREPDIVKCRFCGQAYPSDKYPTSGVTEVKTPSGGIARYPYYESRPQWWKGKEPYRSYFAARVDYQKIRYMENAAFEFARTYKLTNTPQYGRRGALILKRFAEVFPGYCYHFDFPFSQKEIYDGDVAPKDFRGGFRTARWSWWAYMDLSDKLLQAYDILAPSGELAKVGAEDGTRKMLIAMADQLVGNRDDLGNMSPGMWADLIRGGRVLQRPDYVHIGVDRMRRMVTELFFYDGSWQEGAPSYHSQVIGGLSAVFSAARGYSDPAGYKHPETGERFDSLDIEKSMPEVVRAREALSRLRLPDGRLAPVHDTWWTNAQSKLSESTPQLLGGLGHGILARGQGDNQFQAHLTWSPGYGHIHYDGLSLLLFAKGKELLSDIGYTHTKWREWTLLSPAHNVVVVDNANQTANKDTYGCLRAFSTGGPVQIVSVDNPQVYPGVTSTYRRTVALVPVDEANSYLVDVFRVQGGKQHDYFLHGSSDEAQTLEAPGQQFSAWPTLLPEGVQFAPAGSEQQFGNTKPGQGYGYLSNLQEAKPAPGLVELQYRTDKSAAGLSVFTLAQAGDELFTGTNPAIRQAGTDDRKLDQYQRQFAMLRRQGGDSLFVSIIVPHGEQVPVQSVKLVEMSGAAAALEVTAGARHDLILIEPRSARGTWLGKPVEADAELVVLSIQDGNATAATTMGGSLKSGWANLILEPLTPGRLLGVERQPEGSTLIVEGIVPLPGTVITLDHAGKRTSAYTVKAVTRDGEKARVSLVGEAGFDYDAATQTSKFNYLPRESYTGPHTVSLCPLAHLTVTAVKE